MAEATYTHQPATVPVDRVRFETGDTDVSNPLLYNGEIEALLAEQANEVLAAAAAAEAIAAKFARKVDTGVGATRKSFSQASAAYAKLAKRLRARGARAAALPWAGGLSEAEKTSDEGQTDLVQPAFKSGMMRNRRAGSDYSDRTGET